MAPMSKLNEALASPLIDASSSVEECQRYRRACLKAKMPNGESVDVYMWERDGRLMLCDLGDAANYLLDMADFPYEVHRSAVECYASTSDEVGLHVIVEPHEDVTTALVRYIQARAASVAACVADRAARESEQ